MLTLNQSNCTWQEIPTHRKQGQARQKSHLRLFPLLTPGLEYSISATLTSHFATQMPHLHCLLYHNSFSTPNYPLQTPYILQLIPLIPRFLPLVFLYSLPCPFLSFSTPSPSHHTTSTADQHPKSQTSQAYCTLNTFPKFFSAADFQYFELVAAGSR